MIQRVFLTLCVTLSATVGFCIDESTIPADAGLSGNFTTSTAADRGFGSTVGNSLRRVLLSSLEGSAITSISIGGIIETPTSGGQTDFFHEGAGVTIGAD